MAFAVPHNAPLSEKSLQTVVDCKVGLYRIQGEVASEFRAPQDLSINISWPDMTDFSAPLRRILGPAHEKFQNGMWREAFENCCEIFETEARKHFADGVRRRRIVLLERNGNVSTPTLTGIKKMTIGQLRAAYSKIRSRNQTDMLIENVLAQINPDRVEFTHRRGHKRTEAALRRNAGQHIWTVIMALRELT